MWFSRKPQKVVVVLRHEGLDELVKAGGEMAKPATDEIERRKWFRIQHNIPEGVKGAALVTILPAKGAPVFGANYAGSVGKKSDPVGDAEPGKTAETRAYRRAWRHLINTVPELSAEEGYLAEEGTAIEGVVSELVQESAEIIASQRPRQVTSGPVQSVQRDPAEDAARRAVFFREPVEAAPSDEELQRQDQELFDDEQ